ncbi:hypothetical protein QQZ08_005688 [Neonectria magnoliae]|uniref:CCZ1/INTU/HSP4 first Longin domain-containing protein n=1 Tax=Neonectria magnoliae TaxID=2732573 RepID=A0ABR1I2M1_9HYPO
MPEQHVLHLHLFGWQNDPEEERFKVSTLDYLTVSIYNNYAVFFKQDDAEKQRTAEVLRTGLERTLSQARYLVGSIERDPEGGHSFVKKKKDSTVRFIVQWLDSPEDKDKYPSFEDLEDTL